MTDNTVTKYRWESGRFAAGPLDRDEPTTFVTLCSQDFDTEEEAIQDAKLNVKRRTKKWGQSWGGTSVYTIVTKSITQN
jgi:hypothetical protein